MSSLTTPLASKAKIDPLIFRAYDIRGKVGSQITEEVFELIGKGFGTELKDKYKIEHPTVVVGRDARTHSPALENALIKGLMFTGCHVIQIGECPSPLNHFTVCNTGADAGVQVTASHNGSGDNGLKLQTREADSFSGDKLQTLYTRIIQEDFLLGDGSSEEIDATTPYIEKLSSMFGDSGKGMNVVIDTGNGVAGPLYVEVLKKLGCTVTELFTQPDGMFPNHPADPSKWETLEELQKVVVNESTHIGLAFDGDGDRLGIVDETGKIRTADDVLLLLSQDHLSRFPGSPIVFTVSNSGTLDSEIRKWGGNPAMCIVGHSFVEHTMKELGSKLGGEQSGHFFCAEDYFLFDDALVAALHVLRILSAKAKPFSELFEAFPSIHQAPERRPHCPDEHKTRVVLEITKYFSKDYPVITLDGVRIDFGDGAWVGIRQSNTAPKISICMEARTPEKLQEIEDIVLSHVRTYPEIDL